MNSRTALKLTLLLTPAILISMTLGLWADAIRSFFIGLSAPGSYTAQVGPHFYNLPGMEWKDQVTDFVRDYDGRLVRDNPFKSGDAQHPKVGHPLKPLTKGLMIVLARDRETFQLEAFGETRNRLPFNGGYFNRLKAKITIDAEGARPDSIGPVLSHELTHAVMHYSYTDDPDWSPWLAEGFAQWCETDRVDHELGRKNMNWLEIAHEKAKPGSLALVLNADLGQFEGPDNEWFYRASYALVTFLLEAPDLHDKFLAYYDEETAPGPVDQGSFAAKIGDLVAIEQSWLNWLKEQH